MKLEHLTIYGRVKSIGRNRLLRAKGKNFAHLVTFNLVLWEWIPVWAHGSHLRIETPNETYLIYNPQALAFDLPQLVSSVKSYMAKIDAEILSIKIVD